MPFFIFGTQLTVRADCVNLVDQIFHADDTVLGKRFLDDCVVGKSDALLIDLAVATFIAVSS